MTLADNSNKYLSLQYLNKDLARDNGGGIRNLRHDEHVANNREDSRARQLLLRGGLEDGPEHYELDVQGVGGALTPPQAQSPDPEHVFSPSPPLQRPPPVPPQMIYQRPAPVPPQMQTVTSAANIGLKRFNRGTLPRKYQ